MSASVRCQSVSRLVIRIKVGPGERVGGAYPWYGLGGVRVKTYPQFIRHRTLLVNMIWLLIYDLEIELAFRADLLVEA